MLGSGPARARSLDELTGEAVVDLPPALQRSLARHRENLTSMVTALQAAGLDQASIESHLGILIDSYRAELSTALHQLGNGA